MDCLCGGMKHYCQRYPGQRGRCLARQVTLNRCGRVMCHVERETTADAGSALGCRVKTRQLVKHFETREGIFKAVDGVSLEFSAGSFIALLGPSGSGKTTLLRLIAGLEEPTDGNIYFDDDDVTDTDVRFRRLGIVFQGYALFKHMTASENIAFGPRIRKMDVDIEQKVDELLHLIELEEFGGRYPSQLSGGQKQRVAVARALACNPRLLLMDEPFGALDPTVRKSLRQGLKGIVEKLGVTTIMVTHDQEEAWDLADHVVVFHRGRVEQQGTPEELTRDPKTPFVMNFVTDVAYLPSSCLFARRLGVDCLDKSHIMVRLDRLEVFKGFSENKAFCGATVSDKINVGWAVRYWLTCDDEISIEWRVDRAEDTTKYDLEIGQRVFLSADTSAVMPFNYEELE